MPLEDGQTIVFDPPTENEVQRVIDNNKFDLTESPPTDPLPLNEYEDRKNKHTIFFEQNGRQYEMNVHPAQMLGEGGMARVHPGWLLSNDGLQREVSVAIKIAVPPKPAPGEMFIDSESLDYAVKTLPQRLRNEFAVMQDATYNTGGQAVANLDYITNNPYIRHNAIVMELMNVEYDQDGKFLEGDANGRDFLDAYPEGVPLEQAFPLLRGLAAALDAQTEKDILMIDTKPANWFVDVKNPQHVKLTDGGIVARVGDKFDSVSGTLQYMSPEQADRLPLKKESMVRTFAVNAFEVVTGKKAILGQDYRSIVNEIFTDGLTRFQDRTLRELFILDNVVFPDPKKPELKPEGWPPKKDTPLTISPLAATNFTAVFKAAFRAEPERRYPTCSSFVDALERSLHEPSELKLPQQYRDETV